MYINAMTDYINDAKGDDKIDISADAIKDLSWVGIENTKEFKSNFNTKAERDEWKARVFLLFFQLSIQKINVEK